MAVVDIPNIPGFYCSIEQICLLFDVFHKNLGTECGQKSLNVTQGC